MALVVELIALLAVITGFCIWQMRCWRRLKEYCEGCEGELDAPSGNPASFVCLEWLAELLGAKDEVNPVNDVAPEIPREAVQAGADHHLSNHPDNFKLQRLGIAAPLIGVALSTIGFLVMPYLGDPLPAVPTTLSAPADNAALAERAAATPAEPWSILKQMWPLYLGVLAGVCMAIFNQVAQYHSSKAINAARAKILKWVETHVWRRSRKEGRDALFSASSAVTSSSVALRRSAGRLKRENRLFAKTVTSLREQIAGVEKAAKAAETSFASQGETFGKMTDAVKNTINGLGNLQMAATEIGNASKNLSTTSGDLEKAGQVFVNASNHHLNVAKGLQKTWDEQIRQSLDGASTQIAQSAQKLGKPVEEMEKGLKDFNTRLSAAGSAVDTQERLLKQLGEKFNRDLSAVTGELARSAGALEDSASSASIASGKISAAAGQVSKADEQLTPAVSRVTVFTNTLGTTAASIQNAAGEIAAALQSHATTLQAMPATLEAGRMQLENERKALENERGILQGAVTQMSEWQSSAKQTANAMEELRNSIVAVNQIFTQQRALAQSSATALEQTQKSQARMREEWNSGIRALIDELKPKPRQWPWRGVARWYTQWRGREVPIEESRIEPERKSSES